MTVPEVLIEYERRLSTVQHSLEQARNQQAAAALVLAISAAIFFTLGIYSLRRKTSFWWPALPVPVAAAAGRLYGRHGRAQAQSRRLRLLYERAIARVRGDWQGTGTTGEEFNAADHVYARDLNVFGEGSLFELLCTARTGVGKRHLATYLLASAPVEEILARQEAVRELQGRPDLREKVALLGKHAFSESRWETFSEWLAAPPAPFPASLRLTLLITSGLVACMIVAGIVGLAPWIEVARLMAPLVAAEAAVGLLLRGRVNRMIDSFRVLSGDTQLIREGLELLEREHFQATKLVQLRERVRNASRSLRRLELLLHGLDERNKEWFYLPSLLLMLGTQLCMAVETWRIRNGAALPEWLAAWGEFEALDALACYAYENPDNQFPEVTDGAAHFEAQAMRHPLLPYEGCVENDVALNGVTRLYIVSGSNMSGKSTLLRAVGLNAVLALAGAPVSARSLRLARVSVCASLSVIDSLMNGRSKFKAEVDRLRQAIELTGQGTPVLFLIDEILSGTNSRDRRLAAEAVVRRLVEQGAVGALSTHDLALGEIAEDQSLCGVNVHLGSKEGGGPMEFDYRLKPGITRETNALEIARMAGVPV